MTPQPSVPSEATQERRDQTPRIPPLAAQKLPLRLLAASRLADSIAGRFDLTFESIRCNGTAGRLPIAMAHARAIALMACEDYQSLGTYRLGQLFGYRDYTGASKALANARDWYNHDRAFRLLYHKTLATLQLVAAA